MNPLALQHLEAICPATSGSVLERFVDPLNATFAEFSINTAEDRAAFLGQFAHETQGFTHLEENLNYSAERLVAVWPKRFTPGMAEEYAHKPERIANLVYADRMKNGNEASGDGYRYRGRGLSHLTGKSNYSACGLELGLDLVDDPDSVAQPVLGCRTGGWFWNHINGNSLVGDFPTLTLRINGGHLGLDSRLAYRDRALAALTS